MAWSPSGQLDLNAPLETYIAEIKGTPWLGVTVEQVLNMVEPKQFLEVFDDPNAEVFLQERAKGVMVAIGYAGQYIYINPNTQTLIVKLSTYDNMLTFDRFVSGRAALLALDEALA